MSQRLSFSYAVLSFMALTLVFLLLTPNTFSVLDFGENYLPFHNVLEFIGIFISFGIFAMGWATYKHVGSNRILLLSITSLAVGCFDFFHTMSFRGMPDFVSPSEPNKAIYFWLAGRVTDSLSLFFVALPFFKLNFKRWRWLGLAGTVVLICGVSYTILWHQSILPLMFIPGTGLTPLKIGIEYFCIGLSAVTALLFWQNSKSPNADHHEGLSSQFMACASALFAMGGFLFCLYRDIDDLYNFVGHLYKMIGFVYIFRAVFNVCIYHPYEEMRRLGDSARLANESKSRFLANVSHEFRTPLGVISGFTDLLRTKTLDSESEEWVLAIQRNSDQLRFMIDDLLDLTKAETENIAINWATFNIEEVIADVVQGLRLLAEKKGIKLELHFDNDAPKSITSDPHRLRQILVNIIGNAVKFTLQGRVVVQVVRSGTEDLKVVIQDTGVGIPEKSISYLFKPFSQADDSFTRRFGGTGLGLALSKRLAKLLHGDLWLEKSEMNVGSIFAFEIKNRPDLITKIDKPVRKMSIDFLPDLKGVRILAAEDSPDIQFLIRTYLKASGCDIKIVSDGQQAVDAFNAGTFDVILMDIQMPVMDGIQAVQIIREKGWAGPIIALTAHAHQAEKEKVLNSGFNWYLTKPFRKKELIETIDRKHKKFNLST